ncbi:MAG TPA: FAD/NAD(P)-binding protein [Treponemataceae bacterium]|nr:FAD/NAD(P)-binding protein [Treponemataceae bacterium]
MQEEALIPYVGKITKIIEETPDVKTFRVVGLDGKKLFNHEPGQCAMLSVPGISEAMISITSSPTIKEYQEYSIKKAGSLTSRLHTMEEGQHITVRGPYGRPFPVEGELKDKDLLFIAGGIGLAPLRSVINYCRAKPENYGTLEVMYGARSKKDLVRYKEIIDEWEKDPNITPYLTIDREEEGWEGHVGFVPSYVKELNPDTRKYILICGPPIMIKFTVQALKELGFNSNHIYTTMELRMKCGIGKCGRCNIGNQYVCKDGPVFRFDELGELPPEY